MEKLVNECFKSFLVELVENFEQFEILEVEELEEMKRDIENNNIDKYKEEYVENFIDEMKLYL